MGRIAIKVADLPHSRRGERFSVDEIIQLVKEVKLRKEIIYGTEKKPPQHNEVRKAWEEIADIISSLSGVKRSAMRCRKRYNDIQRRGKKKYVVLNACQTEMRKGPTTRYMSSKGKVGDSSNTENSEDVDIEVFVYQAPLEEDPDKEKSPVKEVPEKKEKAKEQKQKTKELEYETKEQPSLKRGAMTQPSGGATKPKSQNSTVQHQDHPFLELQQNGFNMLERELSGFKQSMSCLDTRLNQIEVLLRPLGHIADSLARIATAVERLTCPPD